MIDRGIIKWQPFDSCYSGEKVLKDLNNSKSKKVCPILSEDQLYYLEQKIFDSYHLNENVNVEYFYNGKIYKITGIIESINLQNKNIHIKNLIIYFKQIINVF